MLGDSVDIVSDPNMTMPPEKPAKNDEVKQRYDSIRGNSGRGGPIVVYENYRAYPLYLVSFTSN